MRRAGSDSDYPKRILDQYASNRDLIRLLYNNHSETVTVIIEKKSELKSKVMTMQCNFSQKTVLRKPSLQKNASQKRPAIIVEIEGITKETVTHCMATRRTIRRMGGTRRNKDVIMEPGPRLKSKNALLIHG